MTTQRETGPVTNSGPAPKSSVTTDTPKGSGLDRPYGSAAFKYRTAGWLGPLPVGFKPREKDPPPKGFTGWEHGNAWPDDDQLADWVRGKDSLNIALRLPRDVVGLDVDAWKGGPFVETMTAITEAHGMLPRTWMSTSRSDQSGIRLFRLPFDLTRDDHLAGDLNHPNGSDLTAGEVIHHGHRFAVVWPSVHPETGQTYHWIDQTTGEISEQVPRPSMLPVLPAEWIDHLRGECSCFALKIRMTESKDPVADAFHKWHNKLVSGTYSRHNAARDGSMVLTAYKLQGWPGAVEYLDKLEAAFMSVATTGKEVRSDRKARAEWERAITGAESKGCLDHYPAVGTAKASEDAEAGGDQTGRPTPQAG